MSEEVVTTIWRRRVAWSKAADNLKAWVVHARTVVLVLSSSGAIAETVAATLLTNASSWRTGVAGFGAALLAVATYVTTKFLTVDAIRAWTRARSVSEGLKTEVYKFRAQASPYGGADAIDKLREATSAVEKPAEDLERHVAGINVGEVTPPSAMTHDQYITDRVDQQINGYYRKNARAYAGLLSAFRVAEIVLGLTGTVLGALTAILSSQDAAQGTSVVGAWVAVLTTLGAAIAAHVAANRYDFLVMSYYGTARRLEDLINKRRTATDQAGADAWSAFVKSCEDAISVENESWLAKWMEKEPATK